MGRIKKAHRTGRVIRNSNKSRTYLYIFYRNESVSYNFNIYTTLRCEICDPNAFRRTVFIDIVMLIIFTISDFNDAITCEISFSTIETNDKYGYKLTIHWQLIKWVVKSQCARLVLQYFYRRIERIVGKIFKLYHVFMIFRIIINIYWKKKLLDSRHYRVIIIFNWISTMAHNYDAKQ
jgi:hypothetical protein